FALGGRLGDPAIPRFLIPVVGRVGAEVAHAGMHAGRKFGFGLEVGHVRLLLRYSTWFSHAASCRAACRRFGACWVPSSCQRVAAHGGKKDFAYPYSRIRSPAASAPTSREAWWAWRLSRVCGR